MNDSTQSTGSNKAPSELWPALLALVIGVPLVFVFARAMADAEVRRVEAPLRAMVGDANFAALQRGEKTEQHYVGQSLSAPDFTLPDQTGKPWRLADHRGRVVVMNFWTVTCQPCLEEMPSLIELARRAAKEPDLEVVAVTTDNSWKDIAAVMPPGSPLRVLFDPEKKVVAEKFGTRLFPETWIIDRDGIVRMRVDGPRDWSGAVALEVIEGLL